MTRGCEIYWGLGSNDYHLLGVSGGAPCCLVSATEAEPQLQDSVPAPPNQHPPRIKNGIGLFQYIYLSPGILKQA